MSVFLKIKLKSLAYEARTIRREERKMLKQCRWARTAEQIATRHMVVVDLDREKMHNHRTAIVRVEARATHIAYAFLRGRTFAQVEGYKEHTAVPPHVISKARSMLDRYGSREERAAFEDWLAGKVVHKKVA